MMQLSYSIRIKIYYNIFLILQYLHHTLIMSHFPELPEKVPLATMG